MSKEKTVINVSSNNQSGGLIVGQVNQNNLEINEHKTRESILTKAGIILGILAKVVAIFTYFGIKIHGGI